MWRQVIIIIEGTDGSGKSTLAQSIADAIRDANPNDTVVTLHAGPPEPNSHPLDLYERPLLNYRPGTGHHLILDRWHIGEWIYPEVFGRPTLADTAAWRHIDLFLQSRGAILIHATPPVQTIVANIRKRGDDLVKVRQLQGIHAAYSAMVRASHLPKIRYTVLGNPFVPGEAIRFARWAEGQVQPLRPFVTYVGRHRPRGLLLGDVRHELRDQARQLSPDETREYGPAFGPYLATSGHFLLSHLPYDLFRSGIGLANACDVDNAEELWEALGRPATVALGKNAARCAPWARQVEHPQYIRRFHHKSGAAYGQRIADAL